MVYGTYNELVTGANLHQLITGGPHIVGFPLRPIGEMVSLTISIID